MTEAPWLTIVGVGEDRAAGLSPAALDALGRVGRASSMPPAVGDGRGCGEDAALWRRGRRGGA